MDKILYAQHFDDRDAAPGVKFNDADLLGMPLRITISKRTLKQQGAELKRRDSAESRTVPLADLVLSARAEVDRLFAEIAAKV